MQFRPIRPPFVLAFAADQQGCGHHRINMPAAALASAGLIDARIDLKLWSEAWLKAVKPDIVVFQRQIELSQLDNIKMVRRALPNAFLVYEIDDPLDSVPDSSYHTGQVPPGVRGRISEALDYCDAASTTTPVLAEWLKGLGAKDVRVIGNLLPADKLSERLPRKGRGSRIRVGFAGGISHAGDLALIVPAMREIGAAVDWVFLGCRPPEEPVPIEFHEGVHPSHYQDKLASLDLDLVLAPLAFNYFNTCKSNLRLVEAGACSAAVIAQATPAYFETAPPVAAFVHSALEWTKTIQDFVALPFSKRQQLGAAMRHWVAKHHTYETQIESRLKAWLPRDLPAHFRPGSPGKSAMGQYVVCCAAGAEGVHLPVSLADAAVEIAIEDAAARAMTTGADMLWLRPGTTLSEAAWQTMRANSVQPEVATVSVLGPDGPDAFPTRDRFTPTPANLATQIAVVVGKLWPTRTADVAVPSGAAILIRAPMLSLLGSPDCVGLDGNAEAALVEWSLRASQRQYRHVQVLDHFVGCLAGPQGLTESMATRMKLRGALTVLQAQQPVLTPDERQAIELRLIAMQWTGPRPGTVPFPADYATWAALQRDQPMRMAENAVVAAFGGPLPDAEWILFIDETVTLKPGAAAALIAAAGEADVVYADHEILTKEGLTPVFKPDFDYELFVGRDYVTQICVVRMQAFPDLVPRDRLDLYMRLLYWCNGRPGSIAHVPRVLGTLTPLAPEAVKALTTKRAETMAHLGFKAALHPLIPEAVKVTWRIDAAWQPKVTIVITTTGGGWVLQPCILPLLNLTSYTNYEVVVVHNNGQQAQPELGSAATDPRVRVIVDSSPFNWSALNNWAARVSEGEYLLFLNDDTRVLSADWLTAMVATAQQHDVCAVGARLLFAYGAVQHVGVVAHQGLLGHVHIGLPPNSPGYLGIAMLTHEASAVTGACMLVSREKFNVIGGFREDLSHNYNDVAFCLEGRRRGWRNVVEVSAELTHLGGATRPTTDSEEGIARLRVENAIMGAEYPETDPYWNSNFALTGSGTGVQGLGFEALSWPAESPAGRERVLVINSGITGDDQAAFFTREGAVVFMADVSGFMLTMIAPSLLAGVWDVRDVPTLSAAMAVLGINYVVFCGLSGAASPAAGVEVLRGLKRIGLPVHYFPSNAEVACPRLTFLQDGVDCGEGYKKGIAHCQACIDRYGSPFGYVDVEAWRAAWADLLPKSDEARDAAD
jgi:GT2 family glycosyltransferase